MTQLPLPVAFLGQVTMTAALTLMLRLIADGATKINIHRAKLGSALMVGTDGTGAAAALAATTGLAGDGSDTLQIDPDGTGTVIEAAGFVKALQNIATLRANNGGQAKRLQYPKTAWVAQIANMEAALGQILDVDIAAETTNLAKQQSWSFQRRW